MKYNKNKKYMWRRVLWKLSYSFAFLPLAERNRKKNLLKKNSAGTRDL